MACGTMLQIILVRNESFKYNILLEVCTKSYLTLIPGIDLFICVTLAVYFALPWTLLCNGKIVTGEMDLISDMREKWNGDQRQK